MIFANPENIYEGTFRGKISADGALFNDLSIVNGTLSGGVMTDVLVTDTVNGGTISVPDLNYTVNYVLSGEVDGLCANC